MAPALAQSDLHTYADRHTQGSYEEWNAGATHVAPLVTGSDWETDSFKDKLLAVVVRMNAALPTVTEAVHRRCHAGVFAAFCAGFPAQAFLGIAFLTAAFFVEAFLVAVFFAAAFFAGSFSAVVFLAAAFLAAFFAGNFFAAVFFAEGSLMAFFTTIFLAGAFLSAFFAPAFFAAFFAGPLLMASPTADTASLTADVTAPTTLDAIPSPVPTATPAFSNIVSSAILGLLSFFDNTSVRILRASRITRANLLPIFQGIGSWRVKQTTPTIVWNAVMCARYGRRPDKQKIATWMQTHNTYVFDGDALELVPSYNVAPTAFRSRPLGSQDRPSGTRNYEVGIDFVLGKGHQGPSSTINARAETLTTAPAFRDAVKRRRCLVSADVFYEWQKLDAKTKQPYAIALKNMDIFAFAGLWERWKDKTTGEPVKT